MTSISIHAAKLIPKKARILFSFMDDYDKDGIVENIIGFSLPDEFGEDHIYVLFIKLHNDGNYKSSMISITEEYRALYKNDNCHNPSFDSAFMSEYNDSGIIELILVLVNKEGSFITCLVSWDKIKPVIQFPSMLR